MAKPKTRGRQKGTRNKKEPSWATQHEAMSRRSDVGVLEQWAKKVVVQEVEGDDNAQRRAASYNMLAIRDRTIDAGGIVTSEAAVNRFPHKILDPWFESGVLDDERTPERAAKRLEAGLKVLDLAMHGKVIKPRTASWSDVGGGGGGGVTAQEAESASAHAEMRYFRARDAVGPVLWPMIYSIIIDEYVPYKTAHIRVLTALDLIAEELLNFDPPIGMQRPKLVQKDRTPPPWLKGRLS